MKPPLYLLDVYAIVYRSYFAFMGRPLRNASGENVSAVYGFFRFLFSLFDQKNPGAFAAVFDSRGPTFRHKMYEAYKATRQKTPEDLTAQVPIVEEILRALGVPMLRKEGYEADDLIASMATRCKREGRECWIISGDKDLLQLVGGTVKALRPAEGFGFHEIDEKAVLEEWGVTPCQILDFLSLTGDASDNVPGVRGIGEKTALKLMGQFGSLDGIYGHLDEVTPESLRRKLEAGREDADLSRKLITLDVSLDGGLSSLDDLHLEALDRKSANPIFLREGMKSLIAPVKAEQPELIPAAGKTQESAGAEAGRAEAAGAEGSGAAVSPEWLRSPGRYGMIDTEEELSSLVDACIANGICAFDTETDSLDVMTAGLVGFSISCEPAKAFYIPVRSPDAKLLPLEAARRQLGRLFSSPALLVGHNIKFDLHILRRIGLTPRNRLFDTMIAAWVLDAESNSYSLASLSERHFGMSGLSFGDVVAKGAAFDSVPIAQALQYASEDADFAFRLYSILAAELEEEKLASIFYDVEMPLIHVLVGMEEEGIAVDSAELRRYGADLESELRGIEEKVWSLVGHEFNLASTKQLQEVLFVERKLPVQKRTKTGFSTDTAVLEELAPLDPVPRLILRQRLLSKLKSTYVDTLADLAERTGRVHTTYIQTGAATGRLSSRDPNLQNIPVREEEGRKIRSSFKADPGNILISADYSQIELAVMAHLSGDPALLAAFREGTDIHRRTAALIFGIDEDKVSPEDRRVAKTINFGVIYGMSAFRLARDLGISNSSAQKFIDAYFSTYAGVAEFIRKTIAGTEATGYATTLFGRRRQIPAIRSRNRNEQQAAQRVAVNTPIQGTAADIVKLAMLRVDAMLAERFPDVRMLLQVHDELVFEAAESRAREACAAIKEAMESAAELAIPLRVSIETAPSWGGMH